MLSATVEPAPAHAVGSAVASADAAAPAVVAVGAGGTTPALPLPPVIVEPALPGVQTQRADPSQPRLSSLSSLSAYQPLPSDRESYEAFIRSQQARGDGVRSLPEWRDQETQLISRALLQRKASPLARAGRMAGSRLVTALAALALAGGFWLWHVRKADDALDVAIEAPSPTAPPPSAAAVAAPSTLIVTEPPGAEIVLGGAVVGNTPAEVPRPDAEELCLLRLSGFEPQLVRLSPRSGAVIRIALSLASPASAASSKSAPAPGASPAPR